jgi:hypothetical protein
LLKARRIVYPSHRVLRYSYPGTLEKSQNIDKAATHSFSASRAILLNILGKKAEEKGPSVFAITNVLFVDVSFAQGFGSIHKIQ